MNCESARVIRAETARESQNDLSTIHNYLLPPTISDIYLFCLALRQELGTMDSSQQNLLVILLILGGAGILAGLVGILSSQTLRDEGIRRLVKRWLGH